MHRRRIEIAAAELVDSIAGVHQRPGIRHRLFDYSPSLAGLFPVQQHLLDTRRVPFIVPGYRRCLSLAGLVSASFRLVRSFGEERVEAACQRRIAGLIWMALSSSSMSMAPLVQTT